MQSQFLQFKKDNKVIRDGPGKSNENNQADRTQTLNQRILTVTEAKIEWQDDLNS